jgi:PadR family transcriptional regulator, regulatory protein PadR
MSQQPTLGELEQLVLLAILRLGPDAYGLSIARSLERDAERRLSRGALYTTLDRLELKGFIRWKPEAGGEERGGLPRRTYTVTPRGVAMLRATRRILQRMWRGLEDALKDQS